MTARLLEADTGPADKAPGPIDLAHLDRATFGNRTLRREVLGLFDRQAARLALEIAAASDARLRGEAAHGLRGAALGIGAHAVAAAAAEIEASPDSSELTGALARLTARVAEARLAIGALLARN